MTTARNDADTALLIRAREAYRQVSSNPESSRRSVEVLLAEARQAGEPEALCLALRAFAWAERYRLAHARAKELLDEAMKVARRHHLNAIMGEVLVTRGAVHQELGNLSAADRDFTTAANFVPRHAMSELTAQRATLLANQGRFSEASLLFAEILRDPTISPDLRAKAANNLGTIQAYRGRYGESIALFKEAGMAAVEVGPAMAAQVTWGYAWATVQFGQLTEGIALFEDAVRRYQATGLSLGELYAEYAEALTELRLLPEALDRARHAFEILDRQGIELMAAEAGLRVARLTLQSGDYVASTAAADLAAGRFRRQRRPTWAARADLVAIESRLFANRLLKRDVGIALRAARSLEVQEMRAAAVDAYLTAGRVAASRDRAREAVDAWTHSFELSRGSSLLVRLKGELAASLAAKARGQAQLVRKYTRSGLDDLARHRAAIASTELKALASGHGEELGRIGLAARVGTQPAINVLAWMERTRAAALSQTDVHESQEVGDDLGELRAVQAELVAARRETGKEPPSLRARLAAAEQRIRRATWTAEATGAVPGSALPMPDLRRALGEQVLVEYDVLDGSLIAAVLDAHRTKLVQLGPFDRLRSELDSLLFGLRYLAGNPTATAARAMADVARAGLGRLRELLLAPLRLADHPGLVVVPVKELHQVPWAALHTRPVALAPSASMWARSSRADPPPNTRVVLAAGPELPGAAHEVTELARHLDGATVLAPPDSTVESVTRALDEASLAHLACHCFVRSDNPTFSSLLLSDGYLTVHELDQRANVPHRVILAACESGKDVTYEGNEVLGFVSTLMGKGSAGVIASSVVVPDQDVLPLMRTVHQEVAKSATLARALHAAQSVADSDDPRSMVAALAFNAFGAA